MNNRFGPSGRRSLFANASRNAVLQLIMATGVCFVAVFFVAVCFQAFAHYKYGQAVMEITPWVSLPIGGAFWSRPWTLPLHGFFQFDFWQWVANAIWIYTWGSVVQLLLGYRQIIPLFITASVAGGLLALLVSVFPGVSGAGYLMGAQAGIIALMSAGVWLSPHYRFWFGPNFSLPIRVVAAVYIVLAVLSIPVNAVTISWLAGGAAAGVLYVMALKSGYSMGDFIYGTLDRLSEKMTPQDKTPAMARRNAVLQQQARVAKKEESTSARVDQLLEKIHEKGYAALSESEKAFLKQAASNTPD